MVLFQHYPDQLPITTRKPTTLRLSLPPPPQHNQYLVFVELMHNCVIVIDANETVKLMTVVVIQYESTKIAI